jgi:hypothetical protein
VTALEHSFAPYPRGPRFSRWTAFLLDADINLARHIRLSAPARTPLFNGAMDWGLFRYGMAAGSNRKDRQS